MARCRITAGLTALLLTATVAVQAAPLPPRRPAALGRDVDTTGSIGLAEREGSERGDTAGRLAQADIPSTSAAAPGGRPALSDREIVARANALLNSLTTLVADFTQVGGDGRRLNGLLYLQRPGKVRFEYDKPSTLEVVSDGSTVLVRDRKLNTSDPYPIGQTPLKFLLSNRIDLAREASLKSVQSDADGYRIAIEDSSTLGGTSKITLSFDPNFTTLTRWRVVDPQGYTTTVALSNAERNTTIDPKVFMLNYMRPVE